MSKVELFLEIHKQSSFVNYNPAKVFETYEELKFFLSKHINDLSDADYFDIVELNFYLTLIIGKLGETKISLDRLLDKFGDLQSERIAVLKTVYMQISDGNNDEALKYLNLRPANELTTLKRRIALTKGNKDPQGYIKQLIAYTKLAPADVETWSELAEVYFSIGHYDKSIFAYEEAILIQPYNYVVHARIGQLYHLLYLQTLKEKLTKDNKLLNVNNLINSFKYFSRSVELVSNYVEGWSGLYIVSKKLQELKTDEKYEFKKISDLSKNQLNEIILKEQASYSDIISAKRVLSEN